jgi:hypothetical protein
MPGTTACFSAGLSGFSQKLEGKGEEEKLCFLLHCSVRQKCMTVWRCCGSHTPIKRKKGLLVSRSAGVTSQFRVRASLMVSVINITSQKNPAPAKIQMSGRL